MYRLRSPISPKYIPVPSPTHSFFTHSPTQACSPRTYRWAQADAHKAASLCLLAPSLPIAFPLFRAQSEGQSYAQPVPQRQSQEAAVSSKWSLARTPTADVGQAKGRESPAGCRWLGRSLRAVPARGQGTGSARNHQPLSQTPPGDSLSMFSR